MIKTILVAAAGNDGDAAAFAATLSVARMFAAHIEILHVRLDPVATGVAMTTDTGAGVMAGGIIERLEQDAREREAKARENVTRFCADAKLAEIAAPSASAAAAASVGWHVETGDEPRLIATYGTTADLIVTRRAGDDDPAARSTLEAALLETGRPILVPPRTAMPAAFERVAIAWKATAQAARAVTAAMPFLMRAKQIVVVTVDEEPDAGDDAERLVRNLAWHGLNATRERLAPGAHGAAASLLAALTGRADLLVMGGFGHSQLREWIFGGFTQHVLADAPLPVLMAH